MMVKFALMALGALAAAAPARAADVATADLPCSLYEPSHSSQCPAKVYRTEGGSGHIVITTQSETKVSILDFENALSFATFTTPQGTPVYVGKDDDRDEYYVAIGQDEYYIIPEAFLIGG